MIALPTPLRAQEGPDPLEMPAALLMVDDPACTYCRKWDREVSAAYENSEEGQLAPLVRRRMRSDVVQKFRGIRGTPTFLLLVEGREVGRIIGYAGADFFWGELQLLITKSGLKQPPTLPPADVKTENPSETVFSRFAELRP
jgi:thioredoxin-related protein